MPTLHSGAIKPSQKKRVQQDDVIKRALANNVENVIKIWVLWKVCLLIASHKPDVFHLPTFGLSSGWSSYMFHVRHDVSAQPVSFAKHKTFHVHKNRSMEIQPNIKSDVYLSSLCNLSCFLYIYNKCTILNVNSSCDSNLTWVIFSVWKNWKRCVKTEKNFKLWILIFTICMWQ